ncbi:MAG: PRKR-interacting protein 1 [Ruminococcaceae bacterium]|nr:PRKR-interacting protein 1 [Oscillospiraceae bacterium]
MGFGYVFIGYLTAFLLENTVKGLGVNGAAALIGYMAMFLGLLTLSLYHSDFKVAKWSLIPMMIISAYKLLISLSELLTFEIGMLAHETVRTYVDWGEFFLVMLFQIALLYGIRMISESVGLKLITIKATRNSLFVALYAVAYVISKLMTEGDAVKYLALSMTVLQLVYMVLNLLLIANCAKDICPAGEEDQPIKRSRFALINKIGDAYERNQQRAVENTMREAEEKLRKRQEARNKKKIQHHKRKK